MAKLRIMYATKKCLDMQCKVRYISSLLILDIFPSCQPTSMVFCFIKSLDLFLVNSDDINLWRATSQPAIL